MDTIGQSVLVCGARDLAACRALVHAPLPPLASALIGVREDDGRSCREAIDGGAVRGVSRLMLEFVGCKLVGAVEDVAPALACTLLATLVRLRACVFGLGPTIVALCFCWF